ncbi:MAG TPA: hypothetical protein VG603_08175, partial [Chitinophagales bacterium]|nr:hypothetical protein [Chitinophagales bacterium]
MKTFNTTARLLLVAFISIVLLPACKKESNNSLTADDAADAITYATSSSTGGLADQVADAAAYTYSAGVYKTGSTASTASLSCGVPLDTTIIVAYNGVIDANYNWTWAYLLTCNGNVPNTLSLSGTYNGDFDAPRMSSTNSGQRNWTLTGLDGLSSSPYVFNGSFTRSGTHTSKVRNHYTFTTSIQITVTNLTVSKTTDKITGGSGTVTMTGDVSNG